MDYPSGAKLMGEVRCGPGGGISSAVVVSSVETRARGEELCV